MIYEGHTYHVKRTTGSKRYLSSGTDSNGILRLISNITNLPMAERYYY